MMEIFSTFAPFAIPLAVVFGLLIGSFLNVVIYRTPVQMQREWTVFAKEHLNIELTEEEKQPFGLLKPDSHCPNCHSSVRPWQNIPVVSYLMLGGKCGTCKTPISKRYPAIEILTALLFGLIAYQYGWSWITMTGIIITAYLIALTFIDFDTQYLPDQLTFPLIWIGLLSNYFGNGMASLQQAVLGAICGYLSLWLLNKIHKLLRGFDGMGMGDAKLLAALGAWLGATTLPLIVFLAAFIGSVVGLVLRLGFNKQIAFGPSLAIAGWVTFICYEKVMSGITWWLKMSGFL